ncbi:Spc98 family-domain-containing protein [Lipomyces japonicus]|uniref:Spc98 family-domain-containing protein n=1 Tax=Lipomyces japonicus TaxID=56871 RepID=UPI0034CEBA93
MTTEILDPKSGDGHGTTTATATAATASSSSSSSIPPPPPPPAQVKKTRSRWTPDLAAGADIETLFSSFSLQTKADILAANRETSDPSESKLLGSLPYTLQGLGSTTLPFASAGTISLPNTLSLPAVSILHMLVEPALLYKSLASFVDSPGGLVGQAFRRAIEHELRGYLALTVQIDEQIRKELEAENMIDLEKKKKTPQGWSLGGVTLKKCVYWLREPTLILRLIADMVENSKNENGVRLLNVLHSYTAHGDPFVAEYVINLLDHVSRPFYEFVQEWLYTGDFRDPYNEFFVKKGSDQDSLWEGKYYLDRVQMPSFMTEQVVSKIFQTGKSLDFIRWACNEGDWVDNNGRELSQAFHYGEADTASMERAIDVAYNGTVTHLRLLLTTKFKFLDHLQAMKKYLLLGQGDFVAMLMELLAPSLERPANTLYRHNLTSILETAVRGSNAQYSGADVLRNLDARMLELSHGEIGWDVFTLEYKVASPLDVIFNSYSTRQYLKIFNFLWRLKRVGFVLDLAWRRSITGARGILSSHDSKNVDKFAGSDWKTARAGCAEMIHFICQLEYYILYEVIESSWSTLQAELGKPELTLDQLIKLHARFLANITHKGLLSSKSSKSSAAAAAAKHRHEDDNITHDDDKDDDLMVHQLHEILKIMISFAEAMNQLYDYSVEQYSVMISSTGQVGTDDDHDRGNERHVIQDRVRNIKSKFRDSLQKLLTGLSTQPDTEMRFLGVRLNFNEYYVIGKPNGSTSSSNSNSSTGGTRKSRRDR